MVYSIDYYTYEYGVLKGLMDIFKELTITISTDSYKAYKTIRNTLGELEQTVVAQIDGDRHITFQLIKDFHVAIEESIIADAFYRCIPIEEATQIIVSIIKNEIINLFCK